jgi:hypothetical protein
VPTEGELMIRRLVHLTTAALVVGGLVGSTSAVSATAPTGLPSQPVLRVLSTDADKVTGGDVLVEVGLGDPAAARHLRVTLGGTDVTAAFRPVGPWTYRALLDGLAVGENPLVAQTNGRGAGEPSGRSASVVLTNHPVSGPVFSGPHQQPFYCETVGAGLGPELDATCNAPTQVVYRYRTTAGGFATLADPADRPANLAYLTVNGMEVPYIVRLERGVINRGVYELAALHDGSDPSPFRDETGWNERLVMTFGGGCNVGYHQGTGTAGVLLHDALSRGFAVASNSLLVNETNCNPVIAAETALMTKERFIERYGTVEHTIGWGGSGGAIMQHTITHGYPGILDGLLPQLSYADAVSNAGPPDCALLLRFLATPDGAGFTAAQRLAVGGHRNFNTCLAWVLSFSNRIDATTGCPSIVPANTIYHPVTNPTGVRCALADHLVTQLGRDPVTGFAPATFDNAGVQYGLQALNDGVISVDQFLALNEQMGGFDADGLMQAGRSVGSEDGLERAFSTGLVTSGLGGLAWTPTIDVRLYRDNNVDIHTSFWSVAMHERLVRDGVDPRLHSRWIYAGAAPRAAQALEAMDAWLRAIAADDAPGTKAERAARNRPDAAAPGCWADAAAPKITDLDDCYELFPYSGDLRTVAGAPITSDVTCQRKAPDRSEYDVTFTDAQWDRLVAAFPLGVCDWSRAGIGQVPLANTWQRY